MQLTHVTLLVEDVRRSATFYEKVLQLKVNMLATHAEIHFGASRLALCTTEILKSLAQIEMQSPKANRQAQLQSNAYVSKKMASDQSDSDNKISNQQSSPSAATVALSIAVDSAQQLHEVLGRLSVATADPATSVSTGELLKPVFTPNWGGIAAWISDPDGHVLELIFRG